MKIMEHRQLYEPHTLTEDRTPFTNATNVYNRTANASTGKFKFRCMIFVFIISLLTNAVLSVFFVWAIGLMPNLDFIFGEGSDDDGSSQQQWPCLNPMDDTHICAPCLRFNRGFILFKSMQRHLKKEAVDYSDMKAPEFCCIRHFKHLMEILKVIRIAKLTSSSKSVERGERTYANLLLQGKRNKFGNVRLEEKSVNGYSTNFKDDTITIKSNGYYLVSFIITVKAENLSEQKPITVEITKQGHRQKRYDRLLKRQIMMPPTKDGFRSVSLQETFYFSRITRLHFDTNTSNMTYDFQPCNTVSLALLPHDVESSVWNK